MWGNLIVADVVYVRNQSPRNLHRLSATGIKHITKPGWHGDGGGLYLEVDPSGAKRWAMRLMINGKRRDFGLGSLQKVTLLNARQQAALYREKAYAGINPVQDDKAGGEQTSAISFKKAADSAHLARKSEWSNGKHVDQWINTLRDYAFPIIGDLPVDKIGTPEVLNVLTKIWSEKPETARRLKQRIKTVFEWARVAGHRSGDNPVDLIGQALPKHSARVTHHEALPYIEVGKFIEQLWQSDADETTKEAFEFLIITAARTGEIRLALWGEIDFDNATWTLPSERMKARREHCVPLPARAIELLKKRLEKISAPASEDFIFVDRFSGASLSENRFLNAREAMGYTGRCTPHGFRSTFRDWAAEETTFPNEVVEMALAHTIKSKAEAAYRRGDLLAKRRALMTAWSEYIENTKR